MLRLKLLAFALTLVCSAQSASAQGWLQNTTGIRTPEPIRKIAPNGIRIGRAVDNGTYFDDPEMPRTAPLTFWRTPEGHAFQRTPNGWFESDQRGVVLYRFEERAFDGNMAVLYDRNRNSYVKLTPNEAFWALPGGNSWNFLYRRV